MRPPMKMDRNLTSDGQGKYALVKLRTLREIRDHYDGKLPDDLSAALALLEQAGVVDFGLVGTDAEFMVIRLKDKYAQEALWAYGNEADKDDHEYAAEI